MYTHTYIHVCIQCIVDAKNRTRVSRANDNFNGMLKRSICKGAMRIMAFVNTCSAEVGKISFINVLFAKAKNKINIKFKNNFTFCVNENCYKYNTLCII